jgi:general stress protein 26
MSDDSYEDLTECGLSEELEHELVYTQRECTFMWANKAGEPFGVIMSYLPKDGKLWLTAAERRARISAIRRFPRASVCINSTGTSLGTGKTVSYKGTCTVHDSRDVKDWFYPEFAHYLRPDDELAATTFQKFLDSPARVIIEFEPDYRLSFDSRLMWARSPEVAKPPAT